MPPIAECVPPKNRRARSAVEADCLEQAGAAVARHVRDAHLRHHLEHTVLEGREQPSLRFVGRRPVATDLVDCGEVSDRLEGEPGTNRVGAVAEERRQHVCVPRLVALEEDRAPGAQACVDQAPVHGSGGEQRGDRGQAAAGLGVGEAYELRTTCDCCDAVVGDPLDGCAETLALAERDRNANRRQLLEPGGSEQEAGQLEHVRQRPVHVDPSPRSEQGRVPTSPLALGCGRWPGL